MRVLLIEDDRKAATLLAKGFRRTVSSSTSHPPGRRARSSWPIGSTA
jgi:hypothetical protein